MTSERIKDRAYNGIVVFEFDSNEHGIICYDHTHWYARVCREAEIEENTLSEQQIRRKGRGSARYYKQQLMREYFNDYERFNLTQSNIVAMVNVNVYNPDRVMNKREFALKLLTLWIKFPENWEKATVNG